MSYFIAKALLLSMLSYEFGCRNFLQIFCIFAKTWKYTYFSAANLSMPLAIPCTILS